MASEVRDIQLCILDIMKAIDRVCQEHNLTYYMIAGTLLGAVRHNGFIPWDDDADIALPRHDYELLMAHADEWLPEYYRLVNYKNDKQYPYPFARIHDIRTTYRPYRDFGYVGGVPVDIFPLDGMASPGINRWWHYFKYRFHVHLLYFLTVNPQKHGMGLRYYILKSLRKIYIAQRCFRKMDQLQRQYDFESSLLVADHDNKPERGILPKSVYGTPKKYRFEDAEFYGVSDADAYLRYCYGDYMSPQEAPRLNYRELNLNKSFLE
ncbi:MAG: LicD family protein [Bacteroidales bacterium]|nr:LicD family protein [Bacteroidales bacterium]